MSITFDETFKILKTAPFHGFLSERADFAKAVQDAGMTFIGPKPQVVRQMGDKIAARQLAIDCNVPVIPGTNEPLNSFEEVKQFADEHGYPLMLKAAYGGGGRGMRVVKFQEELEDAYNSATNEALSAFGNGEMFVERYLERPRHIEIQILGDREGNVVHLFERDCSIQRRHQKVVEIAPGINLPEDIRNTLYDDAVRLCQTAGYENAGTVEFLLDEHNNHYFIEVNSRLQVEHTVTEEITGVDLVQSQIRIAEGKTLDSLGLNQDQIESNGYAIQCRVTTEDPAKGFTPDFGRIELFRPAEGMGVRNDSASAFTGAHISPHYDSLLYKQTTKAKTLEGAANKAARALKEVRIRGIKTNVPFLSNVISHPNFTSGKLDTQFIDDHPELFNLPRSQNRAGKLIRYIAEVMVNGPILELPTGLPPADITPTIPQFESKKQLSRGWRDVLKSQGPEGFAKAIRENRGLLITDTTMRDAHQSLLATRVRTIDLENISPYVANEMPNLFSLENWGGATFDVALRFLKECPWERLESLREKIPNIPFQCLLRGANGFGYTAYPDNVVKETVKQSVASGMDIFRVFDSMNYLPNLQLGIDAVGEAGGVIEAAICYTGDVMNTDPNYKYNLKYYLNLVDELVKSGIHILCIKDMAGLLRPSAAQILVGEIRNRYPNLPIHVHTHDTAGTGVASMIACAEAGADIVDAATDSMSGCTSQPSLGAIVASLQNTRFDTGLQLPVLNKYNHYWEETRQLYAPFESSTTMKSGNSDVYINEIPGGQYTNLQFQAYSNGLGDQFREIKNAYAEANHLFGDLVKVTPSSKVVGDMAQFMVNNNLSAADVEAKAADLSFPESVYEMMQGSLGYPEGGFPESLRTNMLQGREKIEGRPGANLADLDLDQTVTMLNNKFNINCTKKDAISWALYPKVTEDFIKFRKQYGPVDRINTKNFLGVSSIGEEFDVTLEKGKTLNFKPLSQTENINKNGEQKVFINLNGQTRTVFIKDKKAMETMNTHPKADKHDKLHVGAPMPGDVISVKVKAGDSVEKGQTIAVISAMKMEMLVKAEVDGVVKKCLVEDGAKVSADDLMVELS